MLPSSYPSIDNCSWVFAHQLVDVSRYPSTNRYEFPSRWIEDTMFPLKCNKLPVLSEFACTLDPNISRRRPWKWQLKIEFGSENEQVTKRKAKWKTDDNSAFSHGCIERGTIKMYIRTKIYQTMSLLNCYRDTLILFWSKVKVNWSTSASLLLYKIATSTVASRALSSSYKEKNRLKIFTFYSKTFATLF